MKKSLFPVFRKRNRLNTPGIEDRRHSDVAEERRPKDLLMKYYHASRSLDETSDSPTLAKERRKIRITPPRSYSDDSQHDGIQAYYYSDSDGHASPSPDEIRNTGRVRTFAFHSAKPIRRGKLEQQESFIDGPNPGGSSPVLERMVDREDITTLTHHVRNFSSSLKELRESFLIDEDAGSPDEIQAQAHNKLGEVVSILKGVLQRYRNLNPTEILSSAGIVIKKVKEHNYNNLDEPDGFFEATDQLALAFSNSVSDYLEEDLSRVGHSHPDLASLDNLQSAEGYDDFDEKMGGDFSEFYEGHSERAESEESLEKIDCEVGKRLSLNLDPRAMNESEHDRVVKPDLSVARAEELDKALISIEGSVDISLQRTKVWSKYAKEIISYMERRAHIESDYCKQLTKLAQTTKAVITEESYLPFQSTYITALEYDINFAKKCQEKLQQELRGKIIEQLTQRRNDHDRTRSKLKEKWNKECKKLNDSIINLKKSKSLYIQKQQELKKFVDKQDKEDGNQSSSVVPSFSIGKKKKEEDVAKRAEEAEEYYKKCVEEANVRQFEIEKTRENVLLELRQLVYQCDMTMRAVTYGYFQMMEHLAAHLPQQYSALAKDSKQSEVGKQFSEFIKLQQTTSKKSTPKRFSFEIYQADDRTDTDKGYIGPADFLNVGAPYPDLADQKESPNPKHVSRRISTASAGSDTSLNRPSSPVPAKKRQNAWGGPNRYSNSDDTASVSSRSLPGSPSTSPSLARKETSQRLSLSNTDMDVRDELKKEMAGPFRNVKMSKPALTHTFKKLRSSSKCKKCDSYVYFNGAECELCGLTCHKKCLETLAIKCGKSRLPRKMTTFGVDFQKHLDATKREDIPIIMEKCITEIDLRCLHLKGIYRVSGVKTKVEALSQQFETAGSAVDLQSTNPNLITSVLRLYLRELPEPLMTFDLYPDFIQIAKDSTGLKFERQDDGDLDHNEENDKKCEDLLRRLHECVLRLPHANYYTVVRLFKHLRRVANNEVFNQMSCNNLAIIFGPTLLRPRGSASSLSALMDMTHQVRVVELLLMNSKILDEDFKFGKTIEEEEENMMINSEAKDIQPRSSSAQSEQDLGYNTPPDHLDDGKQELSLSDELQIDFPHMFKRNDSSGRDITSSFGSLESVPDMSPDIDEELKDIVLRKPIPDRPKSLDFDDRDKVVSPQNLRSGSESNLSFDSMSPVELPDSSIDFGTNLTKRDAEAIVKLNSEKQSMKRDPESSSRNRRKGQIALDFAATSSPQISNADNYEIERFSDDIDSGDLKKLDGEVSSPRVTNQNAVIPTQTVKDEGITCKGLVNQRTGTAQEDAAEGISTQILENDKVIISAHESIAKGVTNEGLATQAGTKQKFANKEVDTQGIGSRGIPNMDVTSFKTASVNKEIFNDKNTDNIKLKELPCEEKVDGNHEKNSKISNNYEIDKNEIQVASKHSTMKIPLTITVSASSRSNMSQNTEISNEKRESPQKRAPRVAPKPTSPIRSLDFSTDIQSPDQTTNRSTSQQDDYHESEGNTPLNISGNTKKLRDRFNAESETKDGDRREKSERATGKESPIWPSSRQSSVERSEKSAVGRSHSNTAKLVEKFTKEVEKKADGKEESPLTRRGVSVKEMLKQFESGDEMDDDDAPTPRKRSGHAREKDSQSPNLAGKSGSASFPREQKQSHSNKQSEEKVRSVSDFGTKREPKFV